jgi:hypothetical protein
VVRARYPKLANPSAESARRKGAKPRFNNGKKQLTGHGESSTRTRTRVNGHKNPRRSGDGTRLAIKDKVLSGSTTERLRLQPANKILENNGSRRAYGGENTPTEHRPPDRKIDDSRGGQQSKVERNRLGRRSTSLRLSEVRNILAAADFTAKNSLPLNRHTTIHFDAAGIADPVASLRRYTKLARDWLRTKGAPFAYIWVRESGDGKGEHAHLLMHVPAHLIRDFARREPSWRKRIGAKRARGGFHSTPVGHSYQHADVGIQYGEPYSRYLAGIISYLVKGADASSVKALTLSRVEPGGELWGKRTGMSENIGRAARARFAKVAKSSRWKHQR